MHISEVRYEKVQNLGNYESQRIGVTIVLTEDESPESAIERARAFVRRVISEPDPPPAPRPNGRPTTSDAKAVQAAWAARQQAGANNG